MQRQMQNILTRGHFLVGKEASQLRLGKQHQPIGGKNGTILLALGHLELELDHTSVFINQPLHLPAQDCDWEKRQSIGPEPFGTRGLSFFIVFLVFLSKR